MAMTSYLQKKLGDHSIGKASYAMPTTVHASLFGSRASATLVWDNASRKSFAFCNLLSKMLGKFKRRFILKNVATGNYDLRRCVFPTIKARLLIMANGQKSDLHHS
jgi:hypothetical protein